MYKLRHVYKYTYIHIKIKHIYIYIYIYTYIHTYTYTHIHIYIYTYIHIYIYTYIHIYIYTHIHIYTYTYIHILGTEGCAKYSTNRDRANIPRHGLQEGRVGRQRMYLQILFGCVGSMIFCFNSREQLYVKIISLVEQDDSSCYRKLT